MLRREGLGRSSAAPENPQLHRTLSYPATRVRTGRTARVGREQERLRVGAVLGLREQDRQRRARRRQAASAMTTTSLGPAGRSMPTLLETSSFAAVTNAFPGPTILSTGEPTPSRRRERPHPGRRRSRRPRRSRALARRRGSRRRPRCDHDDAAHTGDLRRHRGHHKRRGQRRACRSGHRYRRRRSDPAPLGDDARCRLDGRVDRPLRLAERPYGSDHPRIASRTSGRPPPQRSARRRPGSLRAGAPSKRSVHSSSAASPRSRTSATIGDTTAIASSRAPPSRDEPLDRQDQDRGRSRR